MQCMAISNSIEALVRSSGVIFTGTVIRTGDSTLPTLPPEERLAVVSVDRVLRLNRDVPDTVTVRRKDDCALEAGERAVIFAQLWILGEGVAVREEAHLDAGEEEEVAAEVDRLPRRLLKERIDAAELVVAGEVVRIVPDGGPADWAVAELKVAAVLKGRPREVVLVDFPTPGNPLWVRVPHFHLGRRGIFLLHHEDGLERGTLVAPDPLDVQPEQQWHTVRELIGVS